MPVDATGLYVSDASAYGGAGGVMEVDPATGNRTTVSANGNPTGQPNFDNPFDLDVEGTGRIVLVDDTTFLPGPAPGVMRIDPASGDRDRVSENTNPPCCNISFIDPWGIMVKPFSLTVFAIADFAVARVPLAAGTRRGTTLRFTLDERARVLFAVDRIVRGRIAGGRCRPETPRNRDGRRCRAYRRIGTFTHQGRKGENRKSFSGRIGATTLTPGSYRMMARATNGRGRSARAFRTFRVVRAR